MNKEGEGSESEAAPELTDEFPPKIKSSPSSPQRRYALHVEVALRPDCPCDFKSIEDEARSLVTCHGTAMSYREGPITVDNESGSLPLLSKYAESVSVCDVVLSPGIEKEFGTDVEADDIALPFWRVSGLRIHPYCLCPEAPEEEEISPPTSSFNVGGNTHGGSDSTPPPPVVTTQRLPNTHLRNLWPSLHFPSVTKRTLLSYVSSSLLFASRSVAPEAVHCSRLILLHGPPGTGKTSLARALAQKSAARLSHAYEDAALLEVHAHSLFSRWFGESSRLVSALLDAIAERAAAEPTLLLFVLVDEVESIVRSREGGGGNDPADAMRAVNAALTSLDRLRVYANVVVIATTNLTGCVDDAFVDRADLCLHVGLPGERARYEIIRGSLAELVRTGIINQEEDGVVVPSHCEASKKRHNMMPMEVENSLPQLNEVENDGNSNIADCVKKCQYLKSNVSMLDVATKLLQIAVIADGLSGRALRRVPLRAHSICIGEGYYEGNDCSDKEMMGTAIPILSYLTALEEAICRVVEEGKMREGNKD